MGENQKRTPLVLVWGGEHSKGLQLDVFTGDSGKQDLVSIGIWNG